MANCNVMPLKAGKACTGKCNSSACGESKAVWVLAACEGAGMVFEKGIDKNFITPDEQGFFQPLSIPALCDKLDEARNRHHYNQLIVVGSPVDIAWVHASLPSEVARTVVAEVRYPLLAAWFADAQGIGQLKHALSNVVAA